MPDFDVDDAAEQMFAIDGVEIPVKVVIETVLRGFDGVRTYGVNTCVSFADGTYEGNVRAEELRRPDDIEPRKCIYEKLTPTGPPEKLPATAFDDLIDEIARGEGEEIEAMQVTQFQEQYQIFLALALLLLVTDGMISERKRRREAWAGRFE